MERAVTANRAKATQRDTMPGDVRSPGNTISRAEVRRDDIVKLSPVSIVSMQEAEST